MRLWRAAWIEESEKHYSLFSAPDTEEQASITFKVNRMLAGKSVPEAYTLKPVGEPYQRKETAMFDPKKEFHTTGGRDVFVIISDSQFPKVKELLEKHKASLSKEGDSYFPSTLGDKANEVASYRVCFPPFTRVHYNTQTVGGMQNFVVDFPDFFLLYGHDRWVNGDNSLGTTTHLRWEE